MQLTHRAYCSINECRRSRGWSGPLPFEIWRLAYSGQSNYFGRENFVEDRRFAMAAGGFGGAGGSDHICEVLCKVIGKVTCKREGCSCKTQSPAIMKSKADSLKVETARMYLTDISMELKAAQLKDAKLRKAAMPQDLRVATPASLQGWPGKDRVELAGAMECGHCDSSQSGYSITELEGKELALHIAYETFKNVHEALQNVSNALNTSLKSINQNLPMRATRLKELMLTLRNLVISERSSGEVMAYVKSDGVMLEEAYSYATFLEDHLKALLKEVASKEDKEGI